MKIKIQGILLGIILLLALVLRVNQLNSIPVGMTDDEVRLVYSAYTLWHTGHDIANGIFLPVSFILNKFSFTPVSVYITAPFVGLLGLSPFTARLPFALAGVGVVLLTYLTVKRLLRHDWVALIASGVLAVNVWAIQMSRIAYEAGFALLFYLWGTYVFLGDWKKHSLGSVLISMALLFLGFNSYNATKLLYVPLIIILVWYKWKEIRTYRPYVIGIAASLLFTFFTFWYFSLVQGAAVHGGDILIFQNSGAASQAVELQRRASEAPQIFLTLFHNKVTYFTGIMAQHYLYAFSPDYLFLYQEGSGIYSLWSRGNLYLLELPFLLIGILALWIKYRKIFILTLVLLLIAAIPSGVGPEPFTYATRSVFMLPWLALTIAVGIYTLVTGFRSHVWRLLFTVVILISYVYSVGAYLTQYYYEWPRYSAKSFAEDQKDVVSFITRYPDNHATFLITNVSDMFFLQYAFYTHLDPRIIQEAYKKAAEPSQLGNIQVLQTCDRVIPAGVVYITSQSCHTQTPDATISLPDGQIMWNIYLKVPADKNFPK